ncbi:GNAT family N-acetyltransferase [Alteromonas sp. 5E99-2]|uniref:GNAT family N-acetyltransferase n=1 Tax=Alteromonas sp. 5E99-2 TaxID=2817683 RepID=UPI001A995B94|nr:GNAT family protein [Alteromonas sp. 5E99-2]MBO1255541.1 GNAT family N-acetyltransferase [Alteromonas sp. 5E99-2]
MVSLRDFDDEDIPILVKILNNTAVTQYLSSKIPTPYTEQDASWWVNEGSKGDLIKGILYNGELVGCIGVNRGLFEYSKSGELGYWLAADYWRKGIATEAISQLLDYTFEHTEIVRVFASVFSANTGSMQLLLKQGFKQEAVLEKGIFKDGEFYNNHIFAKLK